MVSKASEDLPAPERPVNTTRRSRGISRSMFLRLCWRAPRMAITRAPSVDTCRRLWSKRSFMRSVGAIISARPRRSHWRGQGAQFYAHEPPWGERSKNGGHSPVCEGGKAPAFRRLWTTSQDRPTSGCVRVLADVSQNSSLSICICQRLVLEQMGNIGPLLRSPAAVEKRDGGGEGGDLVPRLGLRWLGKHTSAGERHGR